VNLHHLHQKHQLSHKICNKLFECSSRKFRGQYRVDVRVRLAALSDEFVVQAC
jgi:hypothetical protein